MTPATMRRFVGAALATALTACHRGAVANAVAPVTSIPRDAARFEIDAVDDSTARFRPQESQWVRVGMSAYAVDPVNRDALVARLRIKSIDGGAMSALVTSQVGRVTTSHFLLIARPDAPWWRSRHFWWGAAAGGALGAAATTLAK